MVQVLVVDDEWMVRESIAAALTRDGHEVRLAATGGAALAAVRADPPDVVVLDLRLPDVDGVTVVRGVRPGYTGPVIVCSAVTEESSRIRALDAGADDYLTKPFGMDELRARLRALLRRSAATGAGPVAMLDLVVDVAERTLRIGGEDRRLTPTEWRLLDALCSRPGRLTTYPWLVRRVWGEHHGDETRQTLRTHVRSLRHKIGDDAGRPRFIATEQDAGYRWLVQPVPVPSGGHAAVGAPAAATVDVTPAPLHAASALDHGGRVRPAELDRHELDNALTALRFATYLVGRRLSHPPAPSAGHVDADSASSSAIADEELAARLHDVVLRVCDTTSRRAGPGHGDDPDRHHPGEPAATPL